MLPIRIIVFLTYVFFSFISYSLWANAEIPHPPLRIGITSVILDEQIEVLNSWRDYLQHHLRRSIQFVQRDSYGKITSHLLQGELDFGWICGYPYVQHQNSLKLVAIPIYLGKPQYMSYLIVHKDDHNTQGIQDLNNAVFAYSDPDSNSGYLYAQYLLKNIGKSDREFFKKSFFTWEHRNTVEAVAVGLAQAGVVDSYIWDTMDKQGSILTKNTRIAHKSKAFAFPPIVAGSRISQDLIANMQRTLLSMRDNEQGRHLLNKLNLDGFTTGNDSLYHDIRHMAEAVRRFEEP
jgi:phosphonate transport system substrate-binding protein